MHMMAHRRGRSKGVQVKKPTIQAVGFSMSGVFRSINAFLHYIKYDSGSNVSPITFHLIHMAFSWEIKALPSPPHLGKSREGKLSPFAILDVAIKIKLFGACSFMRTLLCLCLGVMLSALSSSALLAQAGSHVDLTRIYGAEDRDVPTPTFTGTLGQKDTSALQELIDYLKATNITAWQGMQASGTLTDGTGANDQATLTVLNGDHFRLDVETPKGKRSTRINGGYGKTLEVDGKSFFMPLATAKAGLIAFPRLLVSSFPSSDTSFIDRGQVKIDDQMLHRITVEESASTSKTATDQHNINVTDLYFDVSSHLLLKSVSSVQLDSSDRERYLVAVTYGNYQKVQGSLIPYSYSQNLNGQRQWSLQLNEVNLQPTVDTSYFQF